MLEGILKLPPLGPKHFQWQLWMCNVKPISSNTEVMIQDKDSNKTSVCVGTVVLWGMAFSTNLDFNAHISVEHPWINEHALLFNTEDLEWPDNDSQGFLKVMSRMLIRDKFKEKYDENEVFWLKSQKTVTNSVIESIQDNETFKHLKETVVMTDIVQGCLLLIKVHEVMQGQLDPILLKMVGNTWILAGQMPEVSGGGKEMWLLWARKL